MGKSQSRVVDGCCSACQGAVEVELEWLVSDDRASELRKLAKEAMKYSEAEEKQGDVGRPKDMPPKLMTEVLKLFGVE